MEEERSFTFLITDSSVIPSKVRLIRTMIGLEEPNTHIHNVAQPQGQIWALAKLARNN